MPFSRIDSELQAELDGLHRQQLYRQLRLVEGCQGPRMTVDGRDVLMFAGANYLGLAGDERLLRGAHEAIDQYGCAAGGARLISGNLEPHERLEEELARFIGTESSLLFSTGYMANLGVISSLAGAEDVIVSDALNHASTIDACRLSRAETRVFRHNDADDLRRVARQLAGFRRRLLVLDGVYSMDGDVACLRELVPIAREHEMSIVVDDAHGIGVLGPNGRGCTELERVEVDVQIGNLGKALGSYGAFVACSSVMREYLINRCRTFIFTCGIAPAVVGAAQAAVRVIQAEPQRRDVLLGRAEQLRAGLQAAGFDTGASSTHIVPAIVGDNERTMRICQQALDRGVYAQGIRYPSVPKKTARIRFTPTSQHSEADVDEVIETFAELR